ncbi:MAG TPA: hypothetical protein VGM56_13655 [Byssovorax sp.]
MGAPLRSPPALHEIPPHDVGRDPHDHVVVSFDVRDEVVELPGPAESAATPCTRGL